MKRLFLLLLLSFATPSWAGVDQLSESEFRQLAAELAPKVNLFREAWERDPEAQFYGGTTRDYLYWLKGKFREAHSPREAAKVVTELRARPVIDVREFIIGDSDVDIFSPKEALLDPRDFGVRKIDVQKMDVLDPSTELGRNEVHQGFLPAEKIRLTRKGLETSAQLGDGVHEIYTGKLTVHFAPAAEFAKSKYAAEGINHPILLALRYLRLQAINYFQENGGGAVNPEKVLARLDPESAKAVRAVIEGTLGGRELRAPLTKPQFQKWINAAIQKAFRSYTNPNAARVLMNEFRVTELPAAYPGMIDPVNQYVFAKHRDEKAVEQALKAGRLDPARLYRDVGSEFPDGFLYHGTKSEEAFRGILFQGVLASESGSGGAGLYGVASAEKAFAENWGGTPDRLLRFPVKPDAKIIDVTEGEGARAWSLFAHRHGQDYEAFAEAYGADIVRYPYGQTRAYVVKNSAVLGRAQGVHRQLLTLPELIEKAKGIKSFAELSGLLSVNGLTAKERGLVIEEAKLPMREVEAAFRNLNFREEVLRDFLPRPPYSDRVDLVREFLRMAASPDVPVGEKRKLTTSIFKLLATDAWRTREDILLEAMVALDAKSSAARILAIPGVPYFPKVWDKMRTMPGMIPRGDMLEIFHNPNYARETETFHYLIRNAADFGSMPAAAHVLSHPWWTNHPEWAKDFLADDRQGKLGAGYMLLGNEAWNTAHPELMREELKNYLREPQSGISSYNILDLIRGERTPFDAEALDLFLAKSPLRAADLAEVYREGNPHRDLILGALLKIERPDYQTLKPLVTSKLPDEARAKLLAKFEEWHGDHLYSPYAPLADLGIIRDLGGPSEGFAKKLMDAATFYFRRVDFEAEEETLLSKIPTDADRKIYFQNVREFFNDQMAKAPSRPNGWDVFRPLLRQPELPETYEPLLLDLATSPHLPDDLRAELADYTRNLVRHVGEYGPHSVRHSRFRTAYDLLRAQPELLRSPEMEAALRKWLATADEHSLAAYAAALLVERGHVEPASLAVLRRQQEYFKYLGIELSHFGCQDSFALLGGGP